MTATEPRYEIAEAGGRIFLLDTFGGSTWVLQAANSAAPRWKKIGSTESEKVSEEGG
jgi:hypothetical protein